MPYYFAYGSNMSRARLEQRVGGVRALGRARLDGHRHRFSKLGRDGSGKGNIEVRCSELVWGVIYELGAAQLARLGAFELGYCELSLGVSLDGGGLIRASSYQATNIVPGLAPTREYLEHYLVGMREHDLPHDYREHVLRELAHLPGDLLGGLGWRAGF